MLPAVLWGTLFLLFLIGFVVVVDDCSTLRKTLRNKRRLLSPQKQKDAALKLSELVISLGLLKKHQHIAFYWPNDGEIDPTPLLNEAHKLNHDCYLPVITLNKSLLFGRYKPGDKLNSNRFGIPEPTNKEALYKPESMNLVFLPLVGFDRKGGRLGMGGGFYDRAFEANNTNKALEPQLIGLAHSCQEQTYVIKKSWDVPLNGVVTENEFIAVKRANSFRLDQ